jgi:hypothetical protein
MVFCPFTMSSREFHAIQGDVGSCGRRVAYRYPELAWVILEGSASLNVQLHHQVSRQWGTECIELTIRVDSTDSPNRLNQL